MGVKFVQLLSYTMALVHLSRETPLDHTVSPIQEISSTERTDSPEITKREIPTLEDAFDGFFSNGDSTGRWNHSRMLKAPTTLGYDDWWFLTTSRRPVLSYKDYPGRPGVATWKEISSNTADNRQSRKITTPTAAGVSSKSPIHFIYLNPAILTGIIETLFILNSRRWK